MSTLRVRPTPPTDDGCVIDITPKSAGWKHVGFKVCALKPGQSLSGGAAGREACLVVLTGTADVTIGDRTFRGVGARATVFEDIAPGAVYAPAGAAFSATAITEAEVAICTAPGASKREPRKHLA